MFDSLPDVSRDPVLEAVQRFFFDHSHDLAEAARRLGGTSAEARVLACGIHLATTTRIDSRVRRDLCAFHRLLALHHVGDPDLIETALFSEIDPASPQVETICLLTEWLEDLLDLIDQSGPVRAGNRGAWNDPAA